MRCLACGVVKPTEQPEVYPYSGEYDTIITDIPIEPLFAVECQRSSEFRWCVMCHECWHRLCENTQGIDMWISASCWETLEPITAFDDLPEDNPLS